MCKSTVKDKLIEAIKTVMKEWYDDNPEKSNCKSNKGLFKTEASLIS